MINFEETNIETPEQSRELFKKAQKISYYNKFKKMLNNYGIKPLFDKYTYGLPESENMSYEYLLIDSGKKFSINTTVLKDVLAAKAMAK